MKIECYLSESCASENDLKDNIEEALQAESVDADIRVYRINETEAKRLGLMGSPSLLINGEDIMPEGIPGIA